MSILSHSADPIRIYVACLAAYNNGHLHGAWIEATFGADDIFDGIKAILKSSPVDVAEEWAIHDYEGFEGVEIAEYESIERVVAKADFINTHGALGGSILADCAGCVTEAEEKQGRYIGEYDSLEVYAREYIEQTLTEIPPSLEHYIDYAAMGRDMEINGDISTIEASGFRVHIFWGA